MIYLRKPGAAALERLHERCRALPLNYADLGCSSGVAPAGYVVDVYRVQVGHGAAAFDRARQALYNWRMLRLDWVEPCWPYAPLKEGTLVGTLARLFAVWAVNVCRIVRVIDENGPVARFGIAYGTLPGHVEAGEERFQVEWHHADDSVWYEIRAVSKPGGWLTRLGYPLARSLQRCFGRDSLAAMCAAVSAAASRSPPPPAPVLPSRP
jgi:uncharacterized protein (UPF0548 family)